MSDPLPTPTEAVLKIHQMFRRLSDLYDHPQQGIRGGARQQTWRDMAAAIQEAGQLVEPSWFYDSNWPFEQKKKP